MRVRTSLTGGLVFGLALASSLVGCTGAEKQPDTKVAEKKLEPKPAVTPKPVEKPKEPPFCAEGLREYKRAEYRYCARKDGTRHGRFIALADGATVLDGTLKEGQLDGVWTAFYPDGRKRWQVTYKDGVEQGDVAGWYANGTKHYVVPHAKGKPEGAATFWHVNGQKAASITYAKGKPLGKWSFWHDNGKPSHELTYDAKGRQSVHRHWTTTGKKTSAPVGRMANSKVQPTLSSLQQDVIACYQHANVIKPGEGKLAVQFTVHYSGDVTQISIFGADFGHPFMQKCARRAIEGLRFPANKYGPLPIIKTWKLSVSG